MDILSENSGTYLIGCLFILIVIRNVSEIKKSTNATNISVWVIPTVAIIILAIPVLIVLICVFSIYRLMIHLILKTKHGSNFHGLLSGPDAFHAIDELSEGCILTCSMVRCKKYSSEEFFERTKKLLAECLRVPKFNSVFVKGYGYFYMLKYTPKAEEFIKKMQTVNSEEKLTKKQLFELIDYYYNQHTTNKGQLPFQAFIGTQPVIWKDDDYDYYPIIVKTHHAMCDGIALFKVLIALLANKKVVNGEVVKSLTANTIRVNVRPERQNKPKNKALAIFKMIKDLALVIQMVVHVFILIPTFLITIFIYKGRDANILHGPPMTHQKVLATRAEEKEGYVEKVKAIKRRFPGVSFPTIVITAFSASINEFFEKNCSQPPKYVTAALPVTADSSNTFSGISELDIRDVELTNDYSLLFVNLPIAARDVNVPELFIKRPLVQRLQLVNKEIETLRNSLNYQANLLAMKVLGAAFPYPLLRLLVKPLHCTTINSIMAGTQKVIYEDGLLEITDIMSWVPQFFNIGTSFSAITYDGRIRAGMSIDKALISDKKSVQAIVDGVYKYIDILDDETADLKSVML